MVNFPFFPFSYRNYYNMYYPRNNKFSSQNSLQNENQSQKLENKENEIESVNLQTTKRSFRHKKKSSKYNPFANFNFSPLFSSSLEEPILEILGMNLYLDDLIIIGLLFFLYTEGVQDEILFIILILLLLS